MKLGMLFGLMMFAFLDVVAAQYRHAYGREPKARGGGGASLSLHRRAPNSLEYVLLIITSLLVLFMGFPDWD